MLDGKCGRYYNGRADTSTVFIMSWIINKICSKITWRKKRELIPIPLSSQETTARKTCKKYLINQCKCTHGPPKTYYPEDRGENGKYEK